MRIYKMTEEAWNNRTDWDTAIENGQIETVEEIEIPEGSNVDEFMRINYPQYCDSDKYGWE